MKIKTQFSIAMGIMFLVVFVVGIISQDLARKTFANYATVTAKATQLQSDFDQIISVGNQILVTPILDRAYINWKNKVDAFNINLVNFIHVLHSTKLLKTPEARDSLELVSRKWEEQLHAIEELKVLIETIQKTPMGGATKPGLIILKNNYDSYEINSANVKIIFMNEVTGSMLKSSFTTLVNEINVLKEQSIKNIFFAIFIAAVAIFITFIVIILGVQRQIHSALTQLMFQVEAMSEGDFTRKIVVNSNNEFTELSEHINKFVEDFNDIIGGVKFLAEETDNIKQKVNIVTDENNSNVGEINSQIMVMTDKVGELVSDINKSSDTITHFNDRINHVVRKIEDQTSGVEQSTTSIVQMTTSLLGVSDIATKRRQVGESLINIVSDGGEKVQKTNDLVKQTTQDVNDILQIVDIINTIADQTNLLAMNASIEAAHAGEAGKGFAVVAQEIRKLAELTNNNARKIQEVIDIVASRMKTVQESSNESKIFFDHIRIETNNFNIAMEEIARAINEISTGSSEIMGVMKSLSVLSHEIKSDSEAMKDDANNLNTLMDNIRSFGETVRIGIAEVNSGTSDIKNSMFQVKSMNDENSTNISKLHDSVKRFRTKLIEGLSPFASSKEKDDNGQNTLSESAFHQSYEDDFSATLKKTAPIVINEDDKEDEDLEIPNSDVIKNESEMQEPTIEDQLEDNSLSFSTSDFSSESDPNDEVAFSSQLDLNTTSDMEIAAFDVLNHDSSSNDSSSVVSKSSNFMLDDHFDDESFASANFSNLSFDSSSSSTETEPYDNSSFDFSQNELEKSSLDTLDSELSNEDSLDNQEMTKKSSYDGVVNRLNKMSDISSFPKDLLEG